MRLIFLLSVITLTSCSTTTPSSTKNEKPITGVVTTSGDQSPPLSYYVTSKVDKAR